MNPKPRLQIAMAMGYSDFYEVHGELYARVHPDERSGEVPDYCNDRNAIVGAISTLSPLEQGVFGDVLNDNIGFTDNDYYEGILPACDLDNWGQMFFRVATATVENLCHAFITAKRL